MGNIVAHLEKDNTFNVIITPDMERVYMASLQTIGACSTILSIILIYLAIFRTPPQVSTRFQLDLTVLQICFLIFDVHICFLFIPKSTLPYFAGYCMGVMCGPISFHSQFMFAMGVGLETLAMFFVCLLQRFVTITKYLSNTVALNAIKLVAIIVSAIGPLYLVYLGNDDFSKEYMLSYLEMTPKMMWLVEKRGWVIYFIPYPTVNFDYLARLASLASFILAVLVIVGSLTLIVLISKYLSKFSLSSTKFQALRAAVARNLILQFTVFSVFVSIPATVVIIPLLCAIDSGAVVFLISEVILSSRGLASSIVAITFNPYIKGTIRSAVAHFSRSVPRQGNSIIAINPHLYRQSPSVPRH